MRHARTIRRSDLAPWLALAVLLLPPATRADSIFNVTLDVTGLRSNTYGAGGPYSVDFFMTGGQGNDDSVTISNFAVTAASLGTPAAPSGDISGTLSTSLVVGDTSFFNDFNQVILPDATSNPVVITFQMDATTNFDSNGVPDNFAFSILDSTGSPVPTTDTFAGSLFNFDLVPGLNDSQIAVFQTTGASPVIGPPTIVSAATVPEPAPVVLLTLAMPCIGAAAWVRERAARSSST